MNIIKIIFFPLLLFASPILFRRMHGAQLQKESKEQYQRGDGEYNAQCNRDLRIRHGLFKELLKIAIIINTMKINYSN